LANPQHLRKAVIAREFADEKIGLGVVTERGLSTVSQVVPAGAAQTAGVAVGDILVSINLVKIDFEKGHAGVMSMLKFGL
jgi:predicted metalloprotease with PDZ domain